MQIIILLHVTRVLLLRSGACVSFNSRFILCYIVMKSKNVTIFRSSLIKINPWHSAEMDVYWFGGCSCKHEVMAPVMLLNRIFSSVVERRVGQCDPANNFVSLINKRLNCAKTCLVPRTRIKIVTCHLQC